ncbi:GIP [Symbiodinium sp. KB8]|nr:GIP [Symbiodinium sp. KB8]
MGGGRGTTQGKGYGTSETSQGATSAPEVVRDNYIPIFDGQPSSYREYRMRVNLYLKKMALSNKKAEATINLLTSLAGPVWKQVEHLADTAPDQDDGFETILKELDRVYQYDARVEMPKAFEKFFYGLSRPPGQTLIHYCSNHREAARELEKHDVKLPDPVGGWLLLRRSSLSQEQRQLVLSQLENKKLSVAAVEQSLFYLFGQDYKGSRVETHRPTGRGRGYSNYRWQPSRAHYAYTAEDEEYLDYQDNDYYEEAEPSYYEDEPEVYEEIEEPEPPAEESAEATYYGLDDEDEETEEAYAAYLDARRRLAEDPRKAKPEKAVAEKDEHGQTPQNAYVVDNLDIGRLNDAATMGRVVGLQDGGASSMVGGHDFMMAAIQAFVEKGVHPDAFLFARTHKTFLFGGDNRSLADWCLHLPVWVGGVRGRIQCFLVPGEMPILVGRPILKALKVKMDYDHDKVSITGEPWTEALVGPKGEYLLALDDGLSPDTMDSEFAFDYVTDDCVDTFTSQGALLDMDTYLKATGRPGPPFLDEDTMTATGLEPNEPPENVYGQNSTSGLSPAVECPLPFTIWKSIGYGINRSRKQLDRILESAYRAAETSNATFWEVYSGSGNLSAAMAARGFQVRSFDLPDWDFEKPKCCRDFLELLDSEMPHVAWLAPPCTKWSPLQNMNVRNDHDRELLEATRDYHHHTHLKFTRRVFLRMSQYGIVILEHPLSSKAWSTPAFHDLGLAIHVDQCALGATLPNLHGVDTPIKKATKLVTNYRLLTETLGAYRCDGSHQHQALLGQCARLGSRAKAAATYQPAMCERIADCLEGAYYAYFVYGGCATEEALPASDVDMEEYEPSDCEPPEDDDLYPRVTPEDPDASGLDLPSVQDMEAERRFGQGESAPPTSSTTTRPRKGQAEEPPPLEIPGPVPTSTRPTGCLKKLECKTAAEASRIVARIHRNMGHPNNKDLSTILAQSGASHMVCEAAKNYQCPTCKKLAPPAQTPKSTLRTTYRFNERLLSDTIWLQVSDKTLPVITMMDAATRFVAARLVTKETTSEFVVALQRGWIRTFGPPTTLFVDSHRAWGSDEMMHFTTEHGIELVISPGEAHERLAQLERRHQVLRRAVELYLEDNPPTGSGTEALIEALTFVVPQLNQSLSVGGFSPTQWVLGYQPTVPGSLLDSNVNYSHLDPSTAFHYKMECRVRAATAVVKADNDLRLRRALLRQHRGDAPQLLVGQRCFYWREAAGPGPRIRWKGPATVVLVESQRGPNTPPTVYWLVHGTALIRAAPEHVRPDLENATLAADTPALHDLVRRGQNRGTTVYIDLFRTNRKRRREDLADTDQEGTDDEGDQPPDLPSMLDSAEFPSPEDDDLAEAEDPDSEEGGDDDPDVDPDTDDEDDEDGGGNAKGANTAYIPSSRQAPPFETFLDRSETISYGCDREQAQPDHLPEGWTVNENGYMVLDEVFDTWEIKGSSLIRHHYVARNAPFHPQESGDCPVPVEMLTKVRNTYQGGHRHQDRWRNAKYAEGGWWTGRTIFKIANRDRHMAQAAFFSSSSGAPTYGGPKEKRQKDAKTLNERTLSLSDRLAFIEAKRKELGSFFTNSVWEFATEAEAPAGRILKAHFILKWSKNSDGTPRAKARLIIQGFRDPDALAGLVDSTSPTLSRLGRTTLFSLTTLKQWTTFVADVSTAFLQGREHAPSRTLWVRLPADARQLLGITDPKVCMRLKKPMYGLCDAPRAWFDEASRRLEQAGFVKHPLDACLFLYYAPDLRCAIGLHVDDLLGTTAPENRKHIKESLIELFSFRDFHEDQDAFEFLGVSMSKEAHGGHSCGHGNYLAKLKPITLDKGRLANHDSPVTDKERTQLRALLGALQWAATQTSPHLQAMTSMLAGEVPKATIATILAANKALRFAKNNSDVKLQYAPLGATVEDITFVAYSDAAFACRTDLSSQGGYLICLSPKTVLDGKVCGYHLLDWRSFKLPRVARSTLAAEGQAAAEAADCLHFTVVFWKAMLDPNFKVSQVQPDTYRWTAPCPCLFDLLHREELYVSTAADKRTCLEALTTRDKLREIGGETRWVSSERQYADGLTKDSATQLLADRLRTHMHKIVADDTYQASRKKTVTDRQKSAQQFAQPRAAATAAAFAVFSAQVATSEAVRESTGTDLAVYTALPLDLYTEAGYYVFFPLLVLMLILYLHPLDWMQRLITWTHTTSRQACDQATQTDFMPEATTSSTSTTQTISRWCQTDTAMYYSSDQTPEGLALDLQLVRGYNQRLAAAVHRQQRTLDYLTEYRLCYHHIGDLYVTPHGKAWHCSEDCARSRTSNQVKTLTACAYCTSAWVPIPDRLRANPHFSVTPAPSTAASTSAASSTQVFHIDGETGGS